MNKPSDNDVIYYSELKEWYTRNAFRSCSLKYVLEGTIYYQRKGMDLPISADEILMTGREEEVIAQFDSGKPVRSICVDVSPHTIEEVYQCLVEGDETGMLEDALMPPYEQAWIRLETCPAPTFNGSAILKNLLRQQTDCLDREWIYAIAAEVVQHKFRDRVRVGHLPYVKASTRKEVYRRLKAGKEYMEENFMSIESVSEVARECLMSEFHFIRSFQKLYEVSPYQYLLGRRLQHAIRMMQSTHDDLCSIALQCGFPDLATFSKAFNRTYHCFPSVYRSRLLLNG